VSLTPYVHLEVELSGARVGDRLPLGRGDLHHLGTVLRLGAGAVVEIADGCGSSALATLAEGEVELATDPVVLAEPRPRLVLAQALPKARKLDGIVRHACELGVDELRIIDTVRSVVRLDERRAARGLERWTAVVRAACEQARRPRRPAVLGPLRLDRLGRDDELLLVAHPEAPALPSVASVWQPAAQIVLAVGPEGGFTDEEVADAVAGGALAVGLGPSVLRTEHAGAAGLAVLAAATGRWGA
jgi:16S rRNA (uracil1498-N3)-methyltransferase